MKKIFFFILLLDTLNFKFSILNFDLIHAQETRQPAVAGQFYPAQAEELSRQIEQFLSKVQTLSLPKDELIALLVPHAGYVFSGQVAAYGFKLLEGFNPEFSPKGKKIDTVILIGLAHRYHLGNKAAVYSEGSFQTPLGKVKIDREIVRELLRLNPLFEKNTSAHEQEHSLEVELPFLQKTLKNFEIVPILLGNPDLKICQSLGETIAQVINGKRKTKNILLICSSDMSHYPEYSHANRVDKMALAVLQRLEPADLKETMDAMLLQGIPNLHCVFCAEGALFTTIYAVKKLGANEVKILHYANSGDVASGTKNQVVGYTAVAFVKGVRQAQTKEEKSRWDIVPLREEKKMEKTEFKLSAEAQSELLTLARKSIESSLQGKKIEFVPKNPELKNLGAVFVTLRKKGQLRGCIGTTMARRPIYEEVAEMACAAAFQDYRFPPVKSEELKEIKIEISVLSPLEKVKSADEIKPKIHGVYLRQGNYAGLFLPQVWEETGWTKEEFLSSLASHKAGLPEDAWKNPRTDLYVFTVFSFEEK